MAGERYALLIASSEYQNESLQRLSAPPADVEALSDVLRRTDLGGFDVKTLVNQPRAIVELAIQEFFLERKRDDLVLLYFSGHGLKNESNNLYFAMTDTKRRYLEATAVSSRFVLEMMQNSSARQQIVLLDCCFSGAFPRGCTFRADETIGSGHYFDVKGIGHAILTASDDMQYAFEGDEITMQKVTPSIFTEIVVKGIASGEADTDLDGNITLDELHVYVVERLRARNSRQNPQKWYFGLTGDIVLAANPNPQVRALAEELRTRVESADVGVRFGAVIDLGTMARRRDGRRAQAATRALLALTKDNSRVVSAAAKAALADVFGIEIPIPFSSGPPILCAVRGIGRTLDFGIQQAKETNRPLYLLFVREQPILTQEDRKRKWVDDEEASNIFTYAKKKADGHTLLPCYAVSDAAAETIVDIAAAVGASQLILGTERSMNFLRGNIIRNISTILPDEINLLVYA
jgi:uncharacterized caspase-like protein